MINLSKAALRQEVPGAEGEGRGVGPAQGPAPTPIGFVTIVCCCVSPSAL